MPDTKISALASGAPAVLTDLLVIARAGQNFNLTIAQLLALAFGSTWGGLQVGGFNAVKDTTYGVGASAITATLPAVPTVGDVFGPFVTDTDARSGFVFGRNGNLINSVAANYTILGNRFEIYVVFIGGTVGYRVFGEDNLGKAAASLGGSPTGLTMDLQGGRVTQFVLPSLNDSIAQIYYLNPPPSGVAYRGELEWTTDGTARTVPANSPTFSWPNGAPVAPSVLGAKHDRMAFVTVDGCATVHWQSLGVAYTS